jgi:hypothetical protein
MPERIDTYAQFWTHYLRQHARPATRALHYVATLGGVLILGAALTSGQLLLVPAAPIVGYALAWAGHFAVEGNRPATFDHPVWSLTSYFRMLWLFLIGRLKPELERAGLPQRRLSPAPPVGNHLRGPNMRECERAHCRRH